MNQETIFACDALGDLHQYNEQLLWANKELLARCDLLEAELAALKAALKSIVCVRKTAQAMEMLETWSIAATQMESIARHALEEK